MSRGFKDSVVLTQNSPGVSSIHLHCVFSDCSHTRQQHCSLAGASLCTIKAIRAYFQNGTLPKAGTVCEVQSGIFDDQLRVTNQALNVEDWKMLRASYELQQNYLVPIL